MSHGKVQNNLQLTFYMKQDIDTVYLCVSNHYVTLGMYSLLIISKGESCFAR